MSTIRVDNFGPSAGGTTYSARGIAKAWANLNGTGTIALRDSLNVSSVTDIGTGNFDFNFANAMANANYGRGSASITYAGTNAYLSANAVEQSVNLTTKTRSYGFIQGSGTFDPEMVPMTIHGDLA
jgi:hypothetical protein